MVKEITVEAHIILKYMKYSVVLGAIILPFVLWWALGEEGQSIFLYAVLVLLTLQLVVYIFLDRVSKMETHFLIKEGMATRSYGLPYKMKEIEKFSTKKIVVEKIETNGDDASINYTLTNADGHNTLLPNNGIERLIEFFELVPKENSENIWVSSEQ